MTNLVNTLLSLIGDAEKAFEISLPLNFLLGLNGDPLLLPRRSSHDSGVIEILTRCACFRTQGVTDFL